VLVAGGGILGSRLAVPLSKVHLKVRIAEQVRLEATGRAEPTLETEEWRKQKQAPAALYAEALAIRERMRRGGWLAGGFLGLVFGLRLLALSIRRKREDYEPDTANCVSCTRCFWYCPREHQRQKRLRGEASETDEQ
jgi:hypothetical protein